MISYKAIFRPLAVGLVLAVNSCGPGNNEIISPAQAYETQVDKTSSYVGKTITIETRSCTVEIKR